jgi:GTP-binding protein
MSSSVVAIIGRPNVGKSTFFNRVLGERRAVVHDRPGITRDRNAVRAEWAGRSFMLVDTGGFLPESANDRDALVRRQAEVAIGLARAVVFMVDAHTGVTDLDQAIAKDLLRSGQKPLLVVNKVDRPGDPIVHDFHRLGLGNPIPISAENGYGIGDLLDQIVAELPADAPTPSHAKARIAIVGRPNVGKSSLVNALLAEDRMVVEPRPGTTVDAIDSEWVTEQGMFTIVDTAGLRRQAHLPDDAEFYASMRALQAMERADIACLVVDATQGFERQEARVASHALDSGCTVQLLYNKWDLLTEREQAWKRLAADRTSRYPTLKDLPAMPVSATVRTHLTRLPAALLQRIDEHTRKLTTSDLNRWVTEVQRRRAVPSTRLGRSAKIYYGTQTGVGPPQITLFCNAPSRLSENYRRYLLLDLCDTFGWHGTPVRLKFRASE